ncbi:MAG: TolC family protein [Candidatus Eremiobacteraeota bacterium]|nr:TolC family protein [Candidatus Eremiobacteraeota bacterium]
MMRASVCGTLIAVVFLTSNFSATRAVAQQLPQPGPSAQPPQASPQPQRTPQPQATTAPLSPQMPQFSPQPSAPPQGAPRLPPPPQPAYLPKVPYVAPGYVAPPVRVPNVELIGVTQQPFVGLRLGDAITMGLTRNNDLAVAQSNRRIAGYQIVAARGAFDVRFMVQPNYSYSTQAPQNAFFAGPNFGPIVQQQFGVSTGINGVTPGGQQYSVTASGSRINNNTSINTFNPTYPTALGFNLTQPLFRGAYDNEPKRTLQLATINAQNSTAQALLSASNVLANVEDAYWDLVAAWRDVAIQEEALREARAQAASNARLARQGVSAPIDVLQSNTQVNVFQDNVFSALQNVARLQNQLKQLILSDPTDQLWLANLVPMSPVLQLPPEPTLADVVARALTNRPEIDQLRAARASADVNVTYAREQLKPQLDLQLGYTTNGFAGQAIPVQNIPFLESQIQQTITINELVAFVNKQLPPNKQIPFIVPQNQTPPGYLVGGLSQSLNNLANARFPVYQAGLQYSIPFGNHTAKANYAIAQEQVRQTEFNEASLIQRITAESRNALQAYRSARYRLIAARAAREASEKVLASENRRFRAGVSTTYFVLQRQLDVANNRGRELQAQTDLNKAVVELQRVTGSILRDNNLDASTIGSATYNR